MICQTSILCRIPAEVLDNIALEVTALDPYGPPSDLVPLLCTCKHIAQLLAFKNTPDLYARVFQLRFDVAAAKRRFGPKAVQSSSLSKQLKLYCTALRDIKRGDIYSSTVDETLRSAFFLALESDGKNAIQLQKVGLGDFVDRFVRERLCDTAPAFDGWPEESTINAVALWLMWFTTTREKLQAETPKQRQQVIDLVLPYVVMPFRYPSAHAPANHFNMPLFTPANWTTSRMYSQQFPHSMSTAHGPFPLYRAASDLLEDVFHYDINVEFSRPLATTAAKMLYFCRHEIQPIAIPLHIPVDRTTAIALGHTHVSPTQVDVHEVNAHQSVQMVPPPNWNYTDNFSLPVLNAMHQGPWTPSLTSASALWDNDWNRSAFCFDLWSTPKVKGVTYTQGMFNGLWQGRMLIPIELHYQALMVTKARPTNFGEGNPHVTMRPVFMRLREHHCISPEQPVRVGGHGDHFDEGLSNAWMPHVRVNEENGRCLVTDENGNKSIYHTYVPGQPSVHSEETCTSCIEHRERSDEEMRQRSVKLGNHDVDMDMDIPAPDAEVESVFASVGLAHDYEMEEDDSEMEDEYELEESDSANTHPEEGMDAHEVIEPQPARVKCDGIQDMFLTGETDVDHGQAWNHYIFYGRIRPWDGLIALVRVPRRVSGGEDGYLGRWVFTGYVVGGNNFVGTWRALHEQDVGTPTWESAFCMSRRE